MALSKRAIGALGLVFLLAGCETTAPAPAGPVFSAAAFNWSAAQGRGRIDGRLAYRSRGATVYSCQTAGVVLTPETPWVRQRMQTLYHSMESAVEPAASVRSRMPENSPSYDAFIRRAPCDAQNRFSFSGLPDGAWYIITSGQPTPAGAPLAFMRRVVIRGGQAISVTL